MQTDELVKNTVSKNQGLLTPEGALIVETGRNTGRSTKERFIVHHPELNTAIAWNANNKGLSPELSKQIFSRLKEKLESAKAKHFSAFVGPHKLELVSTSSWHHLFAKNMFRDQPLTALSSWLPKDVSTEKNTIRIYHDPYGKVSDLGLKHEYETLILLDPLNFCVAIIGTAYAGEIKKSAFTLCNFELPSYGIFPMHASANCEKDGSNSCVLFGLSGTGKTTLSASSDRYLIGDDEIVWSPSGLSNLEGGCYAKLIDLKAEAEPEIFQAVHQKGAILENVVFDKNTKKVDFSSRTLTENTRGSYPLSSLEKIFRQDIEASAPKNIVFLTADAFGALPAVAKLNSYQAQYFFLAGYTAKIAGTEIGIKEPQTVFSTCFGAPFMPRPSAEYAKLLADYVAKSKANVWLLNTGWFGGPYGTGTRFPIAVSRAILRAIQNGTLQNISSTKHSIFGFEIPTSCPGVDSTYLASPDVNASKNVAKKFIDNNAQYAGSVDPEVLRLGAPSL